MARVSKIEILHTDGRVINKSPGPVPDLLFATSVLGYDVGRLRVRLEVEGLTAPAATATLPEKVTGHLRFRDPGEKRVVLPDTPADARFTLTRVKGTAQYACDVSIKQLGFVMRQDAIPEVATVVREDGTSDKKFRDPLAQAGWKSRGVAILPDKGKADSTGNLLAERPDALTLFHAGGVRVADISLAAGRELEFDPKLTTWAFFRSPADIFFYSGHGLLTNGQLVRSRGPFHDYQDWLSAEALLASWRKSELVNGVPIDLDALIINGCSVLFWNHRGEAGADRGDIGLPWAELLYRRKGPLLTILGYRYRAPADLPMGDRVAAEMGAAIKAGLGFDDFARKWLEINVKIGGLGWGAAAFDMQGYWYINTPTHEGAGGAPIMTVGHDPKQPPTAIMGPFPLP